MLELIASHKSPIHFLDLYYAEEEYEDVDWSRFKGLDLSSLSMISMTGLNDDIAEQFMGLVETSSCEKLTLQFLGMYHIPRASVFAHKLMERVISIIFDSG
jgi:hypothetical protein